MKIKEEQLKKMLNGWRLDIEGVIARASCGLNYKAYFDRSEERRVGKECRFGWWRETLKKKE